MDKRQSVIYHPGIANEYTFDSWEEAQSFLEERHGGLASGMLFNCREIEITDLGEKLRADGFTCEGREWNNTFLNLDPNVEYARPGDTAAIRRMRRLSWKRWAKYFFTDEVGNACLVVVQKWGEA